MEKSFKRAFLIAIAIISFHVTCAFAQENERFKLSGYYKNIFLNSKTRDTQENYAVDTNRLRLELTTKITSSLSSFLSYDNDLTLHDFGHTPEFELLRQNNQKNLAFLDADKKISEQKHLYWKHSLYRGYIKYQDPRLHWTLGKQAVDWSRMRLYHPLDLFNPISPLDIEKDEKIGVDALNIDFYPQNFATISAIYVMGKTDEKNGFGLRASKKIKDYDYALIAAEYKKDMILGANFDGYIKEAGFRGEMTYTKRDNGREFVRASIGLDHNFTSKLYGVAEYFYNGGAEKDPEQFLNSYQSSRQAITMRRNILGTGAEYEISGVTKLANYVFYDFDGRSLFYNPELRYNAKPNLDLSLGVQMFWGSSASEFGNYNHLYYAQAKYYF